MVICFDCDKEFPTKERKTRKHEELGYPITICPYCDSEFTSQSDPTHYWEWKEKQKYKHNRTLDEFIPQEVI